MEQNNTLRVQSFPASMYSSENIPKINTEHLQLTRKGNPHIGNAGRGDTT